jgi:DNA-binding CsgD family transcriptional regulator
MLIDERMLGTIEAIYDAALDEKQWPDALKKLADLTGSQAASFWVLDRSEQPRLPTFTYINFDPRFIEEYLDHVAPLDPTVQYLVAHPNQAIVHDGLFITEREKQRHPYYDWHARSSDTHFRLVNQIRPAPLVQAGVALHRTRKNGHYETNDIEQFALLHRHIERALVIGFRLGSLGTLQNCTTEMLNRNSAAIMLLDENRQVVYTNQAAEKLRTSGDGVSLSSEGVALARRSDNDRLQKLIAQALAIVVARGLSPDGAMQAPRPSGQRPYSILVTPVSRQYSSLSSLRPAVCIVITDPAGQKTPAVHLLKEAFGLTSAEAKLAILLSAGEDLRTAAAKLHVSYGTARARLSEIFRKTDTHRQGELIKLLLTAALD